MSRRARSIGLLCALAVVALTRVHRLRQLLDEAPRAEKVTIDSAQADAEKRVDKLVKDLVIDRAL
jgi:hypothetical protein